MLSNMEISKKDIEHIARLARLKLNDKEVEKYRREISGIVHYVDKLAELNVDKQAITSRIANATPRLRADVDIAWPEEEREAVVSAAALKKERSIQAPRVFES